MTTTKTERDSHFILERTKSWLTVERETISNAPVQVKQRATVYFYI